MHLEQDLAQTQADAEAALTRAKEVTRSLQRLRHAAQQGVLKELPRALEAAEQALAGLQQSLAETRQQCRYDTPGYWDEAGYVNELLAAAAQLGVEVHRQDDRLYCHPSLVRILSGDLVAVIDKARDKRLRPTVLVERLRQLQSQPVRFRSDAFLESLSQAYTVASRDRSRKGRGEGAVLPLAEIYELLTLLPGQAREYSRHEFARDLYLLDESGVRATRAGRTAHLHPARGTEPERRVFATVAKDGRLLRYFGLSFA